MPQNNSYVIKDKVEKICPKVSRNTCCFHRIAVFFNLFYFIYQLYWTNIVETFTSLSPKGIAQTGQRDPC